MDPKFQTSFIPKKTYEGSGVGGTSIVTIVSVLLFLASIIGAAGSYFYNGQLTNIISNNQVKIKNAKDSFDLPTIETLIRLDQRIEASKQLLKSHVAVSPVFDFLEQKTVKSIRFDSLSFSFTPQKATLIARGQAASIKAYKSIAYQSELIADNRLVRDQIFSDFNLDQSGAVSFTFSATVDPRLLLYTDAIGAH